MFDADSSSFFAIFFDFSQFTGKTVWERNAKTMITFRAEGIKKTARKRLSVYTRKKVKVIADEKKNWSSTQGRNERKKMRNK